MRMDRPATSTKEPVAEPDIRELPETEISAPSIRCPLRGGLPVPMNMWTCSCRHVWNTFNRGDVCSAWLQQWEKAHYCSADDVHLIGTGRVLTVCPFFADFVCRQLCQVTESLDHRVVDLGLSCIT